VIAHSEREYLAVMADPIGEQMLQEMSVALSQGRRVRFTADGQASASLEASAGMQQSAADFLGTKVDEINGLRQRGFEVNVDPDGSIYAFLPDKSERYLANPDAAIDTLEQMFVHQVIRDGATLMIEADGSMAYRANTTGPKPSDDVVAQRIAHFDEQVATGKIAAAASESKGFEIAADGSMTYVLEMEPMDLSSGDPAAGGPIPASPPPAVGVPDGDDLRVEAREASTIARQIREVSYSRLEEDATTLGIERDDAARRAWSLQQEANAADMQVKREQATVERLREHAENWEADAAGDDIFAEEAAERVGKATAMANAAQARLDNAQTRAVALREEAAAATADVARLETAIDENLDDYQKLADAARSIELRAGVLETAADFEDQADAADIRAAALRAEGDEAGAVAAEAAAAAARAAAESTTRMAREGELDEALLAEAGIALPEGFEHPLPEPVPEPVPEPPVVIDMEPEVIEVTPPRVIDMEPEIIEVTVPDSGIDENLIEIEDPASSAVSSQIDLDLIEIESDTAAMTGLADDFETEPEAFPDLAE
jgi:hypothetical protein